MKFVNADFQILTQLGPSKLKKIERIARVCYKSEDKITKDGASARRLIKNLIANGHEAMLEHGYITVVFTVDRALSHELVRHRMASFAQESQRYCNYSKDKFGAEITFVKPWWMNEDAADFNAWREACQKAEDAYFELLAYGLTPQQARSVLPNCTKTELVITANYREWRHILKLRADSAAHIDMWHLMTDLLDEFKKRIPVIFDDIDGVHPIR